MLSRGKVTPATVSYYTDTVARGVEDYYAGHGEAPGKWVGSGSSATGLDGEVTAEDLALLFDGVHPGSGESLGALYNVRQGADRVTGWDLTFSAPKTVSALWATAGGEVGMAVREAHAAAVATGIDYLEEHAAFARQGKAGVRQVDTDGYVAAAFVHRSSRTGDPQLHTHVLVSGRVRCGDGVWRALDSRALHRQLKPAGMVYQAALRVELTARLGVKWDRVDRHGQAEIGGVPREVRELFSKRAAQVEPRAQELIADAEAKLGRPLTAKGRRRFYEVAVLETRPAKEHIGEADQGLFDRWRSEAVAAGFDPDRWVAQVLDGPHHPRRIDRRDVVAESGTSCPPRGRRGPAPTRSANWPAAPRSTSPMRMGRADGSKTPPTRSSPTVALCGSQPPSRRHRPGCVVGMGGRCSNTTAPPGSQPTPRWRSSSRSSTSPPLDATPTVASPTRWRSTRRSHTLVSATIMRGRCGP